MDGYTENLAKFGYNERQKMKAILEAMDESGLPDDFNDDNVRFAFNTSTGDVFLVNNLLQVAMVNDGKLESFYSLPYSGEEGFLDSLLDDIDEFTEEEDLDFLMGVMDSLDMEDDERYARIVELKDEIDRENDDQDDYY